MRFVNPKRTICEVLREINDILQYHELQHIIFPKLQEAELMAKKMDLKLHEYNKEWDKQFWNNNPDYEKDLLIRLNTSYITDESVV